MNSKQRRKARRARFRAMLRECEGLTLFNTNAAPGSCPTQTADELIANCLALLDKHTPKPPPMRWEYGPVVRVVNPRYLPLMVSTV